MSEGKFVKSHHMHAMPFVKAAEERVHAQLQKETPKGEDMVSISSERVLGWLGVNFPPSVSL